MILQAVRRTMHRPHPARHLALLLLALALAGLPAVSARAATLSGMPPLAALDGEQNDASTGALAPQTYTVATGGTLESLVWWGFHDATSGGAAFDNFQVLLDGVAQSGSLGRSTNAAGLTRYVLDVADQPLAAGHAGTLSVFNDSLDVQWFWQVADSGTRTLSFGLDGTAAVPVPEPATGLLGALALAAALVSARAPRRTAHAAHAARRPAAGTGPG